MSKFWDRVFTLKDENEFNTFALEMFRHQVRCNPVYRGFLSALGKRPSATRHYEQIPFLPIGFFKTQNVYAGGLPPLKVFLSSGTTGMERSRHYVADPEIYRRSLLEGFRRAYGDPSEYKIRSFVPSTRKAPGSSLAFMVEELMWISEHEGGSRIPNPERKRMIIGLSYALLNHIARHPESDPDLIVIETGGMKGRRKEITREELHEKLKKGFGVPRIHSEYGMSELLSQAWSHGEGVFRTPPWMKVLIREADDPLTLAGHGRTGGINIIDLANHYSCPFLATQDLGKTHEDGSFEVLGRFDHSDLRGCSLMA